MRYSRPETYKNTVLDEYIPAKTVTAEDVRSHVAEILPFLPPDQAGPAVFSVLPPDLTEPDVQKETRPSASPQKAAEPTIKELDFNLLLQGVSPQDNITEN